MFYGQRALATVCTLYILHLISAKILLQTSLLGTQGLILLSICWVCNEYITTELRGRLSIVKDLDHVDPMFCGLTEYCYKYYSSTSYRSGLAYQYWPMSIYWLIWPISTKPMYLSILSASISVIGISAKSYGYANPVGKMCSKQYTFCLVSIMVVEYQENPRTMTNSWPSPGNSSLLQSVQ